MPAARVLMAAEAAIPCGGEKEVENGEKMMENEAKRCIFAIDNKPLKIIIIP